MGKTAWDPQLAESVVSQFNGDMARECWASQADVNSHVKYAASKHADKLSLAPWILQMQAA
jgi:hypothetical protein